MTCPIRKNIFKLKIYTLGEKRTDLSARSALSQMPTRQFKNRQVSVYLLSGYTHTDTIPVRNKRNERLAENSIFGLLFYMHILYLK